MSVLGAFGTQLVRFFEQLVESYPEERDIKMSLEAIRGAKLINPKLVMDLFYNNVCKDLSEVIQRKDEEKLVEYARKKITTEFNDISPALGVFDKHWHTMTTENQNVIWQYLHVLCVLCQRARDAKLPF